MQSSVFNLRVPLPGDEVFLMNTMSDAQLVVSTDVVRLLDRIAGEHPPDDLTDEERDAVDLLSENGFLVSDR